MQVKRQRCIFFSGYPKLPAELRLLAMTTQHPGISHGDAGCHGNISLLDPTPSQGAEETVALGYNGHSAMYSTHTGL